MVSVGQPALPIGDGMSAGLRRRHAKEGADYQRRLASMEILHFGYWAGYYRLDRHRIFWFGAQGRSCHGRMRLDFSRVARIAKWAPSRQSVLSRP